MKLKFIATALTVFATVAQASPTVNLNDYGDIAEFVIDNPTDKSCTVDYEIEAQYSLTSSSALRWHVIEYGVARIKPNTTFTKEIYHRGAKKWRLAKERKSCS